MSTEAYRTDIPSSQLIDRKGLYLLPYFLHCRRVSCK